MLGIKFIKVQPTTYLMEYRGGRVLREGTGLSFFYYAPTTSLVAVPIASTDTPFIFEETTSDFQAVTIQGQVTWRVQEPKRVAALLNYTLESNGRTYVSEDPEKLPERVIHVINVLARAELQKLALREAIPATRDLARAEFATLRLRLLKIAVRVQETASRIRLAFASCCPDADLVRRLAGALAPQPLAASP